MKHLKIVYVVCICLVLAAPILLMPFADTASAEKRELSAFPSLVDEDGFNLAFFDEVNDWMSEHFPFRSQIISVNNYLKAELFATSDEEKVVVGKDGWLFFNETLRDYFGEEQMSALRLKQLISTISLMEEKVSADGADFVFAVAPNKNTIYPEYMPARYLKANTATDLERLTAALKDKPYFADLTAALTDKTVQTYHKRDSHWNAFGALCGYKAIMNVASRDNTLFDAAAYTVKQTWRGDLDDMIFPSLDIRDEQMVYDVDWSYEFTSNYHSEEDLKITTENPNGEGALLMFRDSFSNALLPFMAQTYRTTMFSRVTPYDLRDAASYDTVVIEIVERNLENLLHTAPIMEAPERQGIEANVTEATIKTRQYNGLLHIYGTTDVGSDNVYLCFSNGEDSKIVQAFPIYEAALLGESTDSRFENGFSAYVPVEYENYTVTVMIGKEE